MHKVRNKSSVKPERFRVSLTDYPGYAATLPFTPPRAWPAGLFVAAMFIVFAAVEVQTIRSMLRDQGSSMFDLMTFLFQGFWVLGWSVGVVILFVLTVFLLFYNEELLLTREHLIHATRLGPIRSFMEYKLSALRNPRVQASNGSTKKQVSPARLAHVVFDYAGVEKRIGNAVPVEEAHVVASRLEQAVLNDPIADASSSEVVTHIGDTEIAQQTSSSADSPGEAIEEQHLSPASTLALVIANLFPLAGVILLGWDLGEIMVLFWAENAVIGFYNLLKMARISGWIVLVAGPFFVGHYGGFMVGHLLFVYFLFVQGVNSGAADVSASVAMREMFWPLWPALLVMFVSHGVSYFANFLGRREYVGRRLKEQMHEPYRRVIILHLTIIFGGWMVMLLGSPVFALALLVGLKTAVDVWEHRKQRNIRPRQES